MTAETAIRPRLTLRRNTAPDRATRPGAAWVVPAIVFFAIFALLPMVGVVYLSFTSWSGLGSPALTGAANWKQLVHDPQFWQSLRLSAIFIVSSWLIQTVISLLIGVWAAGKQRGRAVMSAIFFLPLVMSSTAIAITWQVLLDPNFGLAGWLGPKVGFPSGNIIGSPDGALLMVIFVGAWQFIPFHTLLYQGAARQIPRVLYDAAITDGAGRYQQFWHVTLPLVRNTVITSSLIILVGALTSFETVLILTQGGPGTATRILPYEMYSEGFNSYQYGYGSAIAVVLVVVATILSVLMTRLTGFSRMRSTLEGL